MNSHFQTDGLPGFPNHNPTPDKKKSKGIRVPTTVILVFIMALGLISLQLMLHLLENLNKSQASPRDVTPSGELSAEEKINIKVFEEASPSVVFITSIGLRRDFWSGDLTEIPQGTGSGFIWDQEGHVVTNYHVMENGRKFQVSLFDHSVWDADIVGVAAEKDLAVLKIKAPKEKLKPIPVGSSHDIRVGQTVFAIGNPFGLDQTMTKGIVSALGRSIKAAGDKERSIRGVIQTDAPINPGNSGGPLLDSSARLIGVNTAIFSTTGSNAGIGFAVPVDTVNRVVPQLIGHGKIIRPTAGFQLIDDSITQRHKIPGVMIRGVVKNSSADKAGLLGLREEKDGSLIYGDIIEAIDGEKISSTDDLLNILERHKSGDTVEFGIIRDFKRKESKLKVKVTLQGPNDD